MIRVAFIGWRGMVGSVLMQRMKQEGDFHGFESMFFSTSQSGEEGPEISGNRTILKDAYDFDKLAEADIIVTCQGSSYTQQVHPELRHDGWNGYFIDAASFLRMERDATIVLDPVNREAIDQALLSGKKDFIGGNCTVSLLLMAVAGLLKVGVVEWLTTMTYQAASGAGAQNLRELVAQMGAISDQTRDLVNNPEASILKLDKQVQAAIFHPNYPTAAIGAPLAASLIPWIDCAMPFGQTREEWKGFAEVNKILDASKSILVDGICVRIPVMRCHAQALTIKLKNELALDEIIKLIDAGNEWVEIIPNTMEATRERLTPSAVTGSLSVPVGRIHNLNMGPEYIGLFTVGDQLLWGAAEPIRRMFKILLEFLGEHA